MLSTTLLCSLPSKLFYVNNYFEYQQCSLPLTHVSDLVHRSVVSSCFSFFLNSLHGCENRFKKIFLDELSDMQHTESFNQGIGGQLLTKIRETRRREKWLQPLWYNLAQDSNQTHTGVELHQPSTIISLSYGRQSTCIIYLTHSTSLVGFSINSIAPL